MIFAGIDEAGYGPLLGPLVVAGSAFRVEDEEEPAHAAKRLAAAFRAAGLVVADSKVVYGDSRDVSLLERPILALVGGCGHLDELLAAVGVDPAVRNTAPWYAGTPAALSSHAADDGDRLRGALRERGLEFVALAADVVPERRFNDSLGDGNKADLLFRISAGVFERLEAHRRPGETVVTLFDRQGGRRFYGPPLQQRWPSCLVSPLSEKPRRSEYRIQLPRGATHVAFEVEADGSAPHVGLASMLAKCLREKFMSLFNGHFAPSCPGVAPTAGYRQDARRWLDETRATRSSADSELVRWR